jgi:DNA invertase Pin-like site-specific DNA recombinase
MGWIAKAKAAGVYQGRPPTIDVEAVRKLRAEGKGVNVISHTLKISRASVYRALKPSPLTENGSITA